MSLDVSLKLTDVSDISTGRLLVGFEDEKGKLHDGRIKSNGNIYEVKFLEGGTAEVRRKYTDIFAWFRNRWCTHETTRAQALQAKINDILSQSGSNEYRILSGTHKNLLNLVKNSKENTIEVANYGFESNRQTLYDGQIVIDMNKKLMAEGRMIKFNKIDDYNRLVGITAGTVDPRDMHELMEKVAGGNLKPRIYDGYEDNFAMKDLKEWKAFLQANAAKIDIPAKLYRYMHLPEGHQATKETGWEASFARDKAAAMRSFVLKNLPYGDRDLSSATIDLLARKLTEYVDIYAIEDNDERNRKLGTFFAKANWLTPEEQVKFDKLAEKNGKAAANYVIEKKELDGRKLFNSFRNMLSYAFFRQTSKLGLEFFHNRKTPVMFQFADYSGRSYHGREQEVTAPGAWRDGENTPAYREKGGASITSSEMRRAMKLNNPHRLNRDEASINVDEPVNPTDPNIIMV